MRYIKDPAERQRIIAEIKKLNDQGIVMKDACRQNGISAVTYYKFLKEMKTLKKPRAKPESKLMTVTLPDTEERITLIMGRSSDVIQALSHLSSMGAR